MANRVNSFNVQGNQYNVEANLTFDSSPTIGSSNPVTSNGIAEAIQGVALGDSISFGRTDGTPVGYCSISYGNDNAATNEFGIAIGTGNINNVWAGITVGINNTAAGGTEPSVLVGSSNNIFGYGSTAIGLQNCIGSALTSIPNEPDYNAKIYIGYVQLSSKKIYYDPDMENEISVSLSVREYCYFIDKTEGVNRNPGDVYEYYRQASYTYTLNKIANQYAGFSNRCNTITYNYRGLCYYDAANDKNYLHYDPSTQTFSDDITQQSWQYRPNTAYLYYDGISGQFIRYTGTSETSPNAYKIGYSSGGTNWLKVKVYRAATTTSGYSRFTTPRKSFTFPGQRAYIYTKNEDSSKKYKVYSRPDYGDDCDITNTLKDGQLVINMSTGGSTQYSNAPMSYIYICDVDGIPRLVQQAQNMTSTVWWAGLPKYGSCATTLGYNCKTSGSTYGNIIVGEGCNVYGAAEGLAVFGSFCDTDIGPNNSGQAGGLNCGRNNSVKARNQQFHTFAAIGYGNDISFDNNCSGDNVYVIGNQNGLSGNYDTTDVHILGDFNSCSNLNKSVILGSRNYAVDVTQSYELGYNNKIYGIGTTILTRNRYGIWEGTGVSYNDQTGTYVFPQNTLFSLYGIPAPGETYIGSSSSSLNYLDTTENVFLGYAISGDGTTLTTVSSSNIKRPMSTVAIGYFNTFDFDSTLDKNPNTAVASSGCELYGNYNEVSWGRTGYSNILVFGNGLSISGDITENSLFLGSYNTMTGTTGAMFTVGIGSDYNNRKNGFVAFGSGVLAAPSSPDTISAGVSAMSSTGLSSDKMIVTYGMMRDYTGPGGGGSSRPSVASVTLVESDWDGSTFEQTVSLSGMTSGSIVIIQPVGSPQQFNYHNVYLDSQGSGELTFKCTTTPTADITVKVVYWA